jgi:hypothetical protein
MTSSQIPVFMVSLSFNVGGKFLLNIDENLGVDEDGLNDS